MIIKNFLVHTRLMRLKSKNQLRTLRGQNSKKKIGLCHGVFDILHDGHIEHFKNAKEKVDILVVSITSKPFVNKGPRQPLNNDEKRINVLNSIKYIDYVFLNKNKDSTIVINNLKPNLYFKGPDYLKSDSHGNLICELNVLKKNKGKVFFTKTRTQSSTKIFNQNYGWSKLQLKQLNQIKKKYSNKIEEYIHKISQLKINIIGEPIIDKYEYCDVVGVTTKDPVLSILSKKSSMISGGVLASAKMAASFVKEVNLFTYGNERLIKKLTGNKKNIKIFNIAKTQKIQQKTRFINSNRQEKLIQITNFAKNTFSDKEKKIFLTKFKKMKYKNLIVCDFGIGLIENEILNFINNLKVKKYLNVQTNSINLGFNLFTKYNNYTYLCLDTREWELALNNKNLAIKNIRKFVPKNGQVSITMGKNGAKIIDNKLSEYFCPTFVSNVKDTTGSGDAFHIITSMLMLVKAEPDLTVFFGNIYAGMHGQNLGNTEIISKKKFLQNINSILNT